MPCPSWQQDGTSWKLYAGPLVIEVFMNADKSGWLWEVRASRTRRGNGQIARSYSSVPQSHDAKLEAEDALQKLAADINRIIG